MRLDQLVDSLRSESVEARVGPDASAGEVEVRAVSHDSRSVGPGDLFACVVGEQFDGHRFAAEAVDAGAAALLCERAVDVDAAVITVGRVREALGPAAAAILGRPSEEMSVIGITGTNGKTTVSAMVRSGLEAHGKRCELIGTLTGARTTPEAPDLQTLLRTWADDSVEAVVMEVSSHALDMHRVDGTRFAVAAFTNLGRDHLDYHETTEAYFRAKARLFEPQLAERAVVNIDDPYGRLLGDTIDIPVLPVALSEVHDLRSETWRTTFEWRDTGFSVPLAGTHNAANALLAAGILVSLGVPPVTAASGIAATPVIPGRFERVDHDGPLSVVVDYAHTPDALEAVLLSARERTAARVVVVFGCGGDRDRSKRPMMGRVASALGDVVVLTSDNPRTESPGAIIDDVRRGVQFPERVEVIPDRAEAIRHAVARAGPDDLVLIAGKGHETTQIIGDEVHGFDDREVALEALDARFGTEGDGAR